jgi:(2Fe-2S) ferredoxin
MLKNVNKRSHERAHVVDTIEMGCNDTGSIIFVSMDGVWYGMAPESASDLAQGLLQILERAKEKESDRAAN